MYVQELLHNQTLTQIGVQVNLSLSCVTQNRDKDYENGNVYCRQLGCDLITGQCTDQLQTGVGLPSILNKRKNSIQT